MTRIRRHAGICCLAGAVWLVGAHEGGAQEKPAGSAAAATVTEQDATALTAAVDALSAGKQPADGSVSWLGHHFIRSQDDSIYIPFTVAVDKRQLSSSAVSMYVRAVSRATSGRPSKSAWEATYSIDVPPDGRIARAIALTAGTYDVYVAVK